MTKRIFRAIVTVALTVLLAGLVVVTSFLYSYFNRSQVSRLKEELSLAANAVNQLGVSYFDRFGSSLFRFTLVDKDGTVRYDTEADASQMENHADREEIREAFETGSGSSARNSTTFAKKTFYEAVRLDNGDVLRVSVSQFTLASLILDMLPAVCAMMITATVVALILSRKMAKKITDPLLQLDLEHPAENNTYDELAPVLTKINKQHKQIQKQMETLRQKSDEFAQIIFSMSEGLILLDKQGLILSINTAAKQIFSVKDDPVGRDFLSVDRRSDMREAVNGALSGKHSEFSTEKDGSVYQLNISPIVSEGIPLGAVILAFDVTDKAFAQRNRQEFTANVTHELKTPLQSIIGSAELLENGLVKPEDTDRFIANIRREATRLVSLIDDIIRLSQLDENQNPPDERVDLKEIAEEVVETLTVCAAKKNVSMDISGESCTIIGVRRYLYEILYNLCDNAIRYNVDGGKVVITLHNEGNHTVVAVSDTGIGIAQEQQSRIFERFYRVDKSHSKETGGTGLGLSIVKHAVLYHGGKIELESEPGKGTTVTVIF